MIVRMELARSEGFPSGSHKHGYEFVAPLTSEGHLDAEAWREARAECRVRRFWGNEEEVGLLRHVGRGWRFDYDTHARNDDEPFFKLDRHPILVGEYLSVTEHDGMQRPFKVVAIVPKKGRTPDSVAHSG
jgi:hypothetical protein